MKILRKKVLVLDVRKTKQLFTCEKVSTFSRFKFLSAAGGLFSCLRKDPLTHPGLIEGKAFNSK